MSRDNQSDRVESASVSRRQFLDCALGVSAAAVTLGPALGMSAMTTSSSNTAWGKKGKSSMISNAISTRRGLAAKPFFEQRKLQDNLWVVFGGGGNAMILTSGSETLLVDCKLAQVGVTLDREIRDAGHIPTTIFNTHHHPDHIGGDCATRHDGIPLIANKRLTPRAKENYSKYLQTALQSMGRPEPDGPQDATDPMKIDARRFRDLATKVDAAPFTPSIEFDKDHELKIGDEVVNLHYIGPGHTDNDVFLHIPRRNLIHTGDLLFYQLHPYYDANGGGNTRGWQESVKAVIKLCDKDTVVIPGHGEIANVEGLKYILNYFDELRDLVRKAMKEGKTRDEVAKLNSDKWASLGNQNILPMLLVGVYDELKRE